MIAATVVFAYLAVVLYIGVFAFRSRTAGIAADGRAEDFFLAGRSLDVAEAAAGEAAHTDGRFVFVSADRPDSEQRREVLVQGALLGAGSLEPRLVKALRGRPNVARRYLALEDPSLAAATRAYMRELSGDPGRQGGA